MSHERTIVARIAQKFLPAKSGDPIVPYKWGGCGLNPDGEFGFDCSGFVIWLLQPFLLLPKAEDWTAQALSTRFLPTQKPEPGDLVFYGLNNRTIKHVMVYLGEGKCIGATGGNSRVKTAADARGVGAGVMIKPVTYRGDLLGYRNIFAAANGARK